MMTSQNSSSPVPDWLLERYALGELPQERMDAVRQALAADPDGADRLAALERSNAEILKALPPRVVAVSVKARAAQASARTSRSWFAGFGMVAAAALALFVIQGPAVDELPYSDGEIVDVVPTERVKGPPLLLVHRLQGSDSEQLIDLRIARAEGHPELAAARALDRLQISYNARAHKYGLVASLDGRGVLTVHSGERAPIVLEDGGVVQLPHSYELDDAPDFERFFIVASTEPFESAPVLDAIRALDPADDDTLTAPLPLPKTLSQNSVTLTKVP